MLPSSVKSVENMATFRRHLNTLDIPLQPCLCTIAPWRINLMTTGIIYYPFCIDAPLSWVSKDLGAIEVT